jgi:hypothetical protein
MGKETNKKSEGPTCACGRGDLYEEWLKQNTEDMEGVSTEINKADKYTSNLPGFPSESKNQDMKNEI